jgi:hypothetical protein
MNERSDNKKDIKKPTIHLYDISICLFAHIHVLVHRLMSDNNNYLRKYEEYSQGHSSINEQSPYREKRNL